MKAMLTSPPSYFVEMSIPKRAQQKISAQLKVKEVLVMVLETLDLGEHCCKAALTTKKHILTYSQVLNNEKVCPLRLRFLIYFHCCF